MTNEDNTNPNIGHYNKITEIVRLPQHFQNNFKSVIDSIPTQYNPKFWYDPLENSIKIEYHNNNNNHIFIELFDMITTITINEASTSDFPYQQLIDKIKRLN